MTPLADMLVGGKLNMFVAAVPNAQILALSDPHLAEEPEDASP
ncbi:MAG TPA: hypothetical protein VI027_03530 [Rubrobacteraceae bacterium]